MRIYCQALRVEIDEGACQGSGRDALCQGCRLNGNLGKMISGRGGEKMEDQLFTEKQFMEVLGLQPRDIEGMRKAGLPFIHLGRGRRLYLLSATLDWARKNLVSAKDEADEAK